jgi:hypothetical protein
MGKVSYGLMFMCYVTNISLLNKPESGATGAGRDATSYHDTRVDGPSPVCLLMVSTAFQFCYIIGVHVMVS